MDTIKEFLQMDFPSLLVGIFISLSAFIAMASIIGKISEIIGKPVKWIRKKNEDHELLMSTINKLNALQIKHDKDMEQSTRDDKSIKKDLMIFMNNVQSSIDTLQSNLQIFGENRAKDREQSLSIQKELTNSITSVVESNLLRDKQINSLVIANRESLADKINEKYKYYISIEGIPEDEVAEFTSLHMAYKGVGGNHSGDAKYDYCINHLPILPVETKLILQEEK